MVRLDPLRVQPRSNIQNPGLAFVAYVTNRLSSDCPRSPGAIHARGGLPVAHAHENEGSPRVAFRCQPLGITTSTHSRAILLRRSLPTIASAARTSCRSSLAHAEPGIADSARSFITRGGFCGWLFLARSLSSTLIVRTAAPALRQAPGRPEGRFTATVLVPRHAFFLGGAGHL